MELDTHMYSVGQLKLRHLWGIFIQKDSEIVLSKGLEDPENNPYGCWARDLTATPPDRSLAKRTPWAAIWPSAPPQCWHLNLIRGWGPPVVSWSHTVKNQVSMKSDTLQCIQCRVPLLARVTRRHELLRSMTTSLVSMTGCCLLTAESISSMTQ